MEFEKSDLKVNEAEVKMLERKTKRLLQVSGLVLERQRQTDAAVTIWRAINNGNSANVETSQALEVGLNAAVSAANLLDRQIIGSNVKLYPRPVKVNKKR